MSRIAPEIPELQDVPDALRSLVYMQAWQRAARSPVTWIAGVVALGLGVSGGALIGNVVFGTIGLVLGAAAGALAAVWVLFAAILPFGARRALPGAIGQAGGPAFDQIRQADERLGRMVAAMTREGGAGGTADGRDPKR